MPFEVGDLVTYYVKSIAKQWPALVIDVKKNALYKTTEYTLFFMDGTTGPWNGEFTLVKLS